VVTERANATNATNTRTVDVDGMAVAITAPKSRAGERQRQAEDKRLKEHARNAAVEQLRVEELRARALGIEIQRAVAAAPNRAGERQRQAENKRRKQEAAEAEAATKRRRTICAETESMTPAQSKMAQMRARVTAREGTQAHTGDKG
jgi:hypothetical protein